MLYSAAICAIAILGLGHGETWVSGKMVVWVWLRSKSRLCIWNFPSYTRAVIRLFYTVVECLFLSSYVGWFFRNAAESCIRPPRLAGVVNLRLTKTRPNRGRCDAGKMATKKSRMWWAPPSLTTCCDHQMSGHRKSGPHHYDTACITFSMHHVCHPLITSHATCGENHYIHHPLTRLRCDGV